jgi:hypothetical protein
MRPLRMLLLAVHTATAAATTHLKSPGHAVCDFHNNSQLADPGSHFTLPAQTANSPQECCDICGTNDDCTRVRYCMEMGATKRPRYCQSPRRCRRQV